MFQPPDDGGPYPDRGSPWPAPPPDGGDGRSRRWRRTPARSGTRRPSALRLLSITTLVLISLAAIAITATGQNHPLSIVPADNPAAALASPAPASPPASPPPMIAPSATAASQPAASATAANPPVLTRAAAEQVLASFWQANNAANQARSVTLLAGIETGSSYALDAGQYQASIAQDPASSHYVPFTATNAVYYIPREPAAAYPKWWAVRVTYTYRASLRAPGSGYLIFTQDSPDAPWKDALEPYVQPGTSEPTPFISADARGYALQAELPSGTAVSQAATGPVYTLQAFDGILAFYAISSGAETQQFAVFIPAGTASPYIVAKASGTTGQS